MRTRFLAGVAFSMLVAVTSAQVPIAIETRTGPPLVDKGKDWAILSIGGWWIKVNPETAAERIEWVFGKTPESLWWHKSWERPFTRDRRIPERLLYPGNLPASGWIDLQPERFIYVRATTKEKTDLASFCVFYQERAVARIDFTGEVLVPLDATRHAPSCDP